MAELSKSEKKNIEIKCFSCIEKGKDPQIGVEMIISSDLIDRCCVDFASFREYCYFCRY